MTGVTADTSPPAPELPENVFDIAAGQERVLERSSRCGFQGFINYYRDGETNDDPPSHKLDINLTYDYTGTEWWIKFTDVPGTNVIAYGPIPGPFACTNTTHTFLYNAAESTIGPELDGYTFTGSSVDVETVP